MKISEVTREEFLSSFEEYFTAILKDCDGNVGEAMRYATLEGGKRVRPACVYYGAKAAGGNVKLNELLPIAAAIELVHSYSLVHDDMPEMDNDDERRGMPSVHKQFGEATALLAGDGLLTLATGQLLKAHEKAAGEISKAAMSMVYGQAAELAGCADAAEYIKMYSQKTGALIRGAFRSGAICATEGDDLEELLAKFAECISEGIEPKSDVLDSGKIDVEGIVNTVTEFAGHVGLAYQIADDLIDGDKSIVDVVGKKEAQAMLKDHLKQATECAGKLASADELIAFAKELCERKA